MAAQHIFISHTSKDNHFVKALRQALESHRLTVWDDAHKLRGGAKLKPEIIEAIATARQFIVVFSQDTLESDWVFDEVKQALEVEQQRKDDGYRVIPLLLPDFKPATLKRLKLFPDEPLAIAIKPGPSGLKEALPQILAALSEILPEDQETAPEPEAQPIAELILTLRDMKIGALENIQRASATATLTYEPADGGRAIVSAPYYFTAPLGPIEADDLRWYLEKYVIWPAGIFTDRAARVEAQLPQWGEALFNAALGDEAAQRALAAWQQVAGLHERRFSVLVERDLPKGAPAEAQTAANEAASQLLALPWELLRDQRGYLFQSENSVRVRRCLPNRHEQRAVKTSLPIRILLVSPRPEDERTTYLDHRLSALPLISACETLGGLAELTILAPPTFPALQSVLRVAAEANQQFDVIHFDGHGVYDHEHGLGALCFEKPEDSDKTSKRGSVLIHAQELAETIHAHRIPLVFLEACQTAQSEEDPTASVAARLLAEGVASVVAMSHSVLVETARRFVTAFYRELAQGARVGKAMLAGQLALHSDAWRGRVTGAGDFRLQDWFVPVLYQEQDDLQLVTKLPSQALRRLEARVRDLNEGDLPDPPAHSFIGRSRELLKLERMLGNTEQRYAVVRGRGGEGKTTLAVELARWLVRTRRFERAAFVSLEHYTDARGVLDALGRQLLPEGENWSVAQFKDLKEAWQHVERALRDHPTIIVLDNLESVLPEHTFVVPPSGGQSPGPSQPPEGGTTNAPDAVAEIFRLCQDLLAASPATRLLFTSRERLPEPFDDARRVAELRELSRDDAIELVSEVLKRAGLEPKYDDMGNTPQEIEELVAAVGCHARALTLLARETARQGVRATTESVRQLMEELERKHPGNRENSLYASVELSLRRLPLEMREQVKALGVFHGGANLAVLHHVLGVDEEAARQFTIALIEAGLAEEMGYDHLRLDPALPNYLLGQMSVAEQEQTRSRWAEGMQGLVTLLDEQRFQDTQLAQQLALLELPNLLALLAWAQGALAPEEVVNLAGNLESLLAQLGRPKARARATRAREEAARRLGAWNHAQFESLLHDIERLLEQGRLPEAHTAAEQLLRRALAAGEAAYAGAAYDITSAHFFLGRVLKKIGAVEAALTPLAEAQWRSQTPVNTGNTSAERMASAAISEAAECLLYLGRYDEAATAYEEGIWSAEKLGDYRGVAVGKLQLGTVRLQQKRYGEALAYYREARQVFESLGEPGSVAVIWHQIGMAHYGTGQFEQAEQAYRQSLAIEVQQQNLAGESGSLNELGILYGTMGRIEEAVKCFRQAAEICAKLQDQMHEGIIRSNLAFELIKLQRYDEARRELLRAIECQKPYGHAVEPWKAWNILCKVEQATGHPFAELKAWWKARRLYLAYQRDGGQL